MIGGADGGVAASKRGADDDDADEEEEEEEAPEAAFSSTNNDAADAFLTTPTTPFDGWDPAEDPTQRKLLIDLIEKMLNYIPEERAKLADCLNHPLFDKLPKDQRLHLLH